MRLYGIDILRGIAAFGIVGCHLLTEPRTAAGSAILHFCGMNVAVFAVLAGYFTHILPEGLGASLRHRLGRLVPIYVLWTLVFLFVQFILKMVHHEGLAQYGQIGFWISVVFKGCGSGGYLWFIIALIYTQVMALFILRKPVSIVVPLMLAASGIGLSILMPYWNGHGHFMFRLFGFVWLGIALRRVSYGTWRLYGVGALFALILHVVLQSWVHPTLRDLLVSVPLCLFAARLPTCFATPRISAVARFLGKTSLGVYLMHPLTARLGNVLLEHVFAAPYGPGVVLLDWLLAWVGALGLAAVFCSIPSTRRFVQ
ncbi:MAG TPA: hypothetical protein DDY72_05685 [Verrucomicrobia bacterium]|nr:hypothetical protein [Verrucomicrobiota bacterium]